MNDKSEINPAHKAYNCAEGNKLERDLAAARAEIDKTYGAWCGRDYMHLPLCEAVGKAMEASRAECEELREKLSAVQADAARDQRNAAMSQHEAARLLDENKELRERLDRATECITALVCTHRSWTGVVAKCENIDDDTEAIAVLNDLPAEWIGKQVAVSLVPLERGEGVKG